ncbi:MAG: alpha/beta hydrolase-fold protein [Gemmatimonadaceae bacterium]
MRRWSARRCAAVLALVCGGVRPTHAQTSAQTASPLNIGETFTISSDALHETRRINVYLPAAYSATPNAALPVLYMPDGGIAEDFLHVAGLVQVLSGNGTMRPFILVGIENTERRRDLTGPTENPEDRKIAPRVGGSSAFRSFIRMELMPAIRARYRTTSETAIVGESLAGLFVVETFLVEPDLFNTYVAFDPSLWWNKGALVPYAGQRLPGLTTRSTQLYVATSREPMIAPLTQEFAEVLRAHAPTALTWHVEFMSEETHATIFHPAALRAFREVFKPTPANH